jgi:hypothetical protein
MNTYQSMNPEAFTEEYEEEQRILAELAQPEVMERDPLDYVREAEESEEVTPISEDECEAWDKFWMRFDFPFEGGE